MIVVTSAGNSGPNQYITGSPGTADGAIATAANDSTPEFPGAGITLSNGVTMDAMNANGYAFSGPFTGEIEVITNNPATPEDESLGCAVSDYLPAAGKIAVVNRGDLRPCRARCLRPAGRGRRRDHGQQRHDPAPVRGQDHRQPRHG